MKFVNAVSLFAALAIAGGGASAAMPDDGDLMRLAEAKPAKNGAKKAPKAFKTATIDRVRIGAHPDKSRLVLDMSGPVAYSTATSADGKTVTVDLTNVNWTAKASGTGGKSGIASYGFTPANGNGKLAITAKEAVTPKVFVVCPDDDSAGRKLVVDLMPKGAAKPAMEKAAAAKPAETQAPAQAAAEPARPAPTKLEQPPAETALPEPRMAEKSEAAAAPNMAEGLYLRLDVGGGITHDPGYKPNAGWPAGQGTTAESDATNSILGQAGIGYRFSPEFRSDFTLGYRTQGVDYDSAGGGGLVKGETDIRTVTAMVNAYYDVGTFSGFTPYLGAGLGWARHWSEDIEHTSAAGLSGTEKSNGDSTFAWAVGAGVSYAIEQGWAIDMGYRFTDLGKPTIGKGWTDSAGTNYGGSTLDEHMRSHDLTVGLRYDF
jgi:opacity protein-like surface antigen